jgi:phage tail-like protein
MQEQRPRYAVLRDRLSWEVAERRGLTAAASGALVLAPVPAPADGEAVVLPGPYEVAPSGLATGPCRELYIADTARHRVVAVDEVCDVRLVLSPAGAPGEGLGQLSSPRGLLVGPGGRLYVADSGNARVKVHQRSGLELLAIWEGPLRAPEALAADSRDRVYVLDGDTRRVLRLDRLGRLDHAYAAALAAAGEPGDPRAIAVDGADRLYVSDAGADIILRYGPDGEGAGQLAAGPARPRALAVGGSLLYVADAAEGRIWVYDREQEVYLGAAPGYRGPVAAMCVDAHSGALLVKPGDGEQIVRLAAGAGAVAGGELRAGPLDAGERASWGRVYAEVEAPEHTGARLALYTADDPAAAPGPLDWSDPGSLDALAPPLGAAGRFLWVRVELTSADGRASPRLEQVVAESAGQGYMRHLPALYRRGDAESGFLRRWLELVRGQFGDLGRLIDGLPRRLDARLAPDDYLPWLASWLAFDLPDGAGAAAWRVLIERAPELYRRRGTPAGLREMIAIYTGVTPVIVEAFRERHIWQLGVTSALGFDTALAPLAPDGIVVPDDDAPLVVGEVLVGQSGPLEADDLGAPLFDESAYRFSVLVLPQPDLTPARREALCAVVAAERPAYTAAHVCFVEPLMRVGLQARVGVDSIVAAPPPPHELGTGLLGHTARLASRDGDAGLARLGSTASIGRDTRIV